MSYSSMGNWSSILSTILIIIDQELAVVAALQPQALQCPSPPHLSYCPLCHALLQVVAQCFPY